MLVTINAIDGHSGIYGSYFPLAPYLGNIAFLVLLLAGIGRATNGYYLGVIIDNRNRVSLSKLQAVMWTVLVFAAFATVVAMRLHTPDIGNAMAIDIPSNLLAAMGISATSLVATPAILTMKTASPTSANADIRPKDEKARLLDLFTGDDDTNYDSPDLSKIQQALITLLVVGFYGVLIGHWLASGTGTTTEPGPLATKGAILPDFESHVAWLLGISSAGYLGYKAAPHGTPGEGVGRAADKQAAADQATANQAAAASQTASADAAMNATIGQTQPTATDNGNQS